MLRFLAITILLSLSLLACSESKPPVPVKLAQSAQLVEVASNQEPASPYWLGSPRENSFLFMGGELPGQGRLVYTKLAGASAIDAGQEPAKIIEMRIIKRNFKDRQYDLKQQKEARDDISFVKRSTVGPAYTEGSGTVAYVPVENGQYLIIITAPNGNLLDNALGLIQKTRKGAQ